MSSTAAAPSPSAMRIRDLAMSEYAPPASSRRSSSAAAARRAAAGSPISSSASVAASSSSMASHGIGRGQSIASRATVPVSSAASRSPAASATRKAPMLWRVLSWRSMSVDPSAIVERASSSRPSSARQLTAQLRAHRPYVVTPTSRPMAITRSALARPSSRRPNAWKAAILPSEDCRPGGNCG